MVEEDRCVFPPDQHRERHSEQMVTAESEETCGREIDFRDAARAVEAHIASRREVVKLLVALDSCFTRQLVRRRIRPRYIVARTVPVTCVTAITCLAPVRQPRS